MTCVICGTGFNWASFGGPAEPCDCGRCVTKDDVNHDEELSAALPRLREMWARGEDDDATER